MDEFISRFQALSFHGSEIYMAEGISHEGKSRAEEGAGSIRPPCCDSNHRFRFAPKVTATVASTFEVGAPTDVVVAELYE